MQNMPIGIFRGDDTDAFSYQTIVGTINTDLDLTGCKAVFRYLGFSMEFDPIPEDRKLTIVIPADETKKFPPGLGYASLRVYDSDGRLKTFSNRIMVFVATKTPMFGSDEFEVDFNVRATLEPLKFFVGPNPDDFDEYRGYLEKVIDRASASKYGLAILLDAIDSDLGANDGVAATPVAVKAAYAAIIEKLTNDYYTAEQTDEAIDRVAAYYITYDAAGNPFPTYAALANAQTVYSGGAVRIPTRNDYCVVLADETHQGAEYRYIYAVAEGQTTGSWQPQFPVEGVMTVDPTVTKNSQNPVSGGGVWSAIWGALSVLPAGFTSLYDWVVAQLGLKRDLTDMSCAVAVTGIPQIGSGNFVVTSPSGTSTTLTPFDSSGVIGWGWYMTYPYIYARASNSYDIIFGTGISDMIPLDMTAGTQTVTYNGETWTVAAFTGEIVNTRLANMTDIPAPSTATPAMDGTGAAGTSAAFARGDHVHPTDTSRMAASATGADIPVDATVGAQKIDAALAGKATKADATLTERGFSKWNVVCSNPAVHGVVVYDGDNQKYQLYDSDNPDWLFDETEAIWPEDSATSLQFSYIDAGLTFVATRTALQGYRLGPYDPSNPNRDKPLASEAEAEALRTNVAGKYTKPETGIPKIDLAEGIQASLDKADTAPIVLDVAHHSRITVGDVEFEVVLYWNSGARDRFFMVAQRVGTWLTQSGEWQSSAEAYTHTWESGGVTYTATRAAGNYFTPVYINGVKSSLNNIASRCAGQDLGDTAKAFYDTLNAYFATCDGDGNRISDTYARKASPGHAGNLAALDANGNPTDSLIPAANVATKGDLRYALTSKTISNGAVSLDDRAINAVAVSSALASLTVNFPTATSGKARDFGLRLTVASGITTAPQIVLPQGVVCENADGEAPEIGADGAATILYFTETASGVFLVKGEVLQTITA